MIIWPKQLERINELATADDLDTLEVLALPLRLRVTITFKSGVWLMEEIDMDGKLPGERK